MERDWMVFYKSFLQAVRSLPDQNRLAAYDAILDYGIDGKEYDMKDPIATAMYYMAKPQVDANNKRFENGMKGAEHWKKGGRPRKENPLGVIEENPLAVICETPKEKEKEKVKEEKKVAKATKEKQAGKERESKKDFMAMYSSYLDGTKDDRSSALFSTLVELGYSPSEKPEDWEKWFAKFEEAKGIRDRITLKTMKGMCFEFLTYWKTRKSGKDVWKSKALNSFTFDYDPAKHMMPENAAERRKREERNAEESLERAKAEFFATKEWKKEMLWMAYTSNEIPEDEYYRELAEIEFA